MPDQKRRSQRNRTSTRKLSDVRRRRIQSKRMTVTISVVVIAFCIVVGAQMINKYSTLKSLQAQEQKLKNQYKKELQLSEELKEQKEYVQTDDYVEQMARNLGLLYPNEVIFKPEE